jgi:hypothetical protein
MITGDVLAALGTVHDHAEEGVRLDVELARCEQLQELRQCQLLLTGLPGDCFDGFQGIECNGVPRRGNGDVL